MKSSKNTLFKSDEGTVSSNGTKPNYNAFISWLLSNPSTTKEDRERIVELLLKERDKKYLTKEELDEFLVNSGFIENKNEHKKNNSKKDRKKLIHNPKYTAEFFSLFNRREGFKYLTHNYDNAGTNMEDMVEKAKSIFDNYRYSDELPGSLRLLMNCFINGGEWKDFEGEKHSKGYSSKDWFLWSEQNGNMHPIMDIDGREKIIQRFRHTIRVVAPDLQTIVESITKKFPAYNFELINLGKADFYTNVYMVRRGLWGIIKDMTDHKGYKNIKIEYKPGFDGDYFIRQIVISQIGSGSLKPIDEVIEKFKTAGGFFAENAERLMGYCNWSVESLWDSQPYRWNILRGAKTAELEQISEKEVVGFTHILTFYYRD